MASQVLSNLLPVEVSRLVYTYLGQNNCPRTQDIYRNENPELKEIAGLVEKRILRTLDLDLNGRGLKDLLAEYTLMKYGIGRISTSLFAGAYQDLSPIQQLKRISDFVTSKAANDRSKQVELPTQPISIQPVQQPKLIQPVQQQPADTRSVKSSQSSDIKNQSPSKSSLAGSLGKLSSSKLSLKCRHCNFVATGQMRLGRHLRKYHQSTLQRLPLQSNTESRFENSHGESQPRDLFTQPHEDSSNSVSGDSLIEEVDVKPNIVNGILILDEDQSQNSSPVLPFVNHKSPDEPLDKAPKTLFIDPTEFTSENWNPMPEPEKANKSRNKWAQHVNKTVDQSKNHKCSECHYTSTKVVDVKRHSKSVHQIQQKKQPQSSREKKPPIESSLQTVYIVEQTQISTIKIEPSDICDDSVGPNELLRQNQMDILTRAVVDSELNVLSIASENVDMKQCDPTSEVHIQASAPEDNRFRKIAPKPSNLEVSDLKKCEKCDFTALTLKSLRYHESLHRKCKCSSCRSFGDKKKLSHSRMFKHKEDPLLPCLVKAGKKIVEPRKKNLQIDLQYKCSVCSRSFVEKRSLLCHMVNHKDKALITGLMKTRKQVAEPKTDFGKYYKDNVFGVYVCNICNYTSHASNIKRHVKRYHDSTDVVVTPLSKNL